MAGRAQDGRFRLELGLSSGQTSILESGRLWRQTSVSRPDGYDLSDGWQNEVGPAWITHLRRARNHRAR